MQTKISIKLRSINHMQHSHSKHCDLKDLRAILASYSNKKLSPPLTMSIVVMTTYSST